MSRASSRSVRVRRALLAVAAFGLVLAVALALGWSGLLCEIGTVRLSVRAPRNPLVLAVASLLIAWVVAPAGRRARTLADDVLAWWRGLRDAAGDAGARARTAAARTAPVIAALVAIAVVVIGFREGALVAGGSDSYGYVSQAHLWATGKLRVEPPLLEEMSPVVTAPALAPLGYHLSKDGATLVPAYAPGLPMTMAAFERVAGREAVFWVVPLLGGVAIWASWLLGRRVAGPWCGALAAMLVGSSPAFLFQLTSAPMSDLAAGAWWTLALALLVSPARGMSLASGIVAGIAVLTRPNLVPLAIVPGVFLLWEAIAEWRTRRAPPSPAPADGAGAPRGTGAALRLLGFLAGIVPGCLGVAAVNAHLYGSPLASGYDVQGLFDREHALPNLARYPVLATEMHTPLIWLGLAAPLFLVWRVTRDGFTPAGRRAAWMTWWLAVAVFACYLFYPAFDAYYRLRFLVPGIPAVLVLTSAGLLALLEHLFPKRSLRIAVVVAVLAAWHGVTYGSARAAFDTEGEYKYALVGDYILRELPENAVLFAMQHSGSVRYYTGRGIVRYDQMPNYLLDRALARLRRLGYRPYFVLERWEEEPFRERFERTSRFGRLDWAPVMELEVGDVRIWDVADRRRSGPVPNRVTEVVPWPFPRK